MVDDDPAAAGAAPAGSVRIFLNYRRDDAQPYAGRLYDTLVDRFGDGSVFMDIEEIEPGVDFGEVIGQHVDQCDAFIVLIGKRWLTRDSKRRRRLDNPEDWVRLEIQAALEREIHVFPVLVQGAHMPRSDELPEPLAPLTMRNAVPISDERWRYDSGRLLDAIAKLAPAASDAQVSPAVEVAQPPARQAPQMAHLPDPPTTPAVSFGATPSGGEQAQSLLNEGILAFSQGRPQDALQIFESLVARYGSVADPTVHGPVAWALVNAGVVLNAMGRTMDTIPLFDEVVSRFGADTDPIVHAPLATALGNKGIALFSLGRAAESVPLFDQVVARFGSDLDPAVRGPVALALVNKGFAMYSLGQPVESIEVFDEVVARFGADVYPAVRAQVAMAMFNKGFALQSIGRPAEALEIFDQVMANFGGDVDPAIAAPVLRANQAAMALRGLV